MCGAHARTNALRDLPSSAATQRAFLLCPAEPGTGERSAAAAAAAAAASGAPSNPASRRVWLPCPHAYGQKKAHMHTHMHTCIHAYIHTYTHTHAHDLSSPECKNRAPRRNGSPHGRGVGSRSALGMPSVRPTLPGLLPMYVCMYVCTPPVQGGCDGAGLTSTSRPRVCISPPPPARGCRSPKTFACTLRFRFLDAASSKNGVLPGGVDASVSGSAGGTSVAHVSAACCSAPLSSLTRSGSPAPAGVEEDRNLRLGTGRLGSERLGMGRIAPREQLDGITRPHSRSGTAGAPAGGRQQEHVEACQQAPTIGW